MKILTLGILLTMSALSYASIGISLSDDVLTYSYDSAENLYKQMKRQGAKEIVHPELPIPPNKEYGIVKEISYKNAFCAYYVSNPNFSPDVDIVRVKDESFFSCTVDLK
ncbi:MAG: hypothetical protein AB8E15_09540 [Bdellovibrionales bacterium]